MSVPQPVGHGYVAAVKQPKVAFSACLAGLLHKACMKLVVQRQGAMIDLAFLKQVVREKMRLQVDAQHDVLFHERSPPFSASVVFFSVRSLRRPMVRGDLLADISLMMSPAVRGSRLFSAQV